MLLQCPSAPYLCCLDEVEELLLPELPEPPTWEPEPKDSEFWLRDELSELLPPEAPGEPEPLSEPERLPWDERLLRQLLNSSENLL